MNNILDLVKKYSHKILFFVSAAILVFTLFSYLFIGRSAQHMYTIDDAELAEISQEIRVGIVFGGGVTEDRPLPLVRERLDTAKQLLEQGLVDVLLLSGDNRSLDYNEPAVMLNYLLEAGVDEAVLQPDFAGRSTYETCERAQKVFGVDRALLISESTHLPRAIYTCRQFNIEAYGVQSDGQASSGRRVGQRWREVLARNKALFNIYIYGEQTVLGDPIVID